MQTPFKQSPEWLMGAKQQERWARFVAARGGVVLPTYGMQEVDSSTKAPVLFHRDGLLVVPDLLVLSRVKPSCWHEVKAKSTASWRRMPPGPRWEHGIDFSLLKEYSKVENLSGLMAIIVVHELSSPANLSRESQLTGQEAWLWMTLAECVKNGQRRPKWPGNGKHSRKGLGGWLWARSEMHEIKVAVKP
jgi:hypothetical protein